jgi:hypothetical protein
MKTNRSIYSILFLLLLPLFSMAQLQISNATNLQLQQSFSRLRLLQSLPQSSANLNDTTSNFTVTNNNRRVYAAGHSTTSISSGPYEYLMISDYKDSLVGNSMKHFAYQAFRFTSSNLLRVYANKITSSSALSSTFGLTSRSSNFGDEIIEVRNYSNAKVLSLEFPSLNGSEKDISTEFKVVLEAASVSSSYPEDERETTKRYVPVAGISLTSSFKVTVSGISNSATALPRIKAVSPIKITTNTAAAGQRYQLNDFTIDVSTGFIQEWAQWIQSPNRATDLRTFRLAYMDVPLRKELLVLELLDVEIISMNNIPAPDGRASLTTRIGLRPRRINVIVN